VKGAAQRVMGRIKDGVGKPPAKPEHHGKGQTEQVDGGIQRTIDGAKDKLRESI
jgi:uncharacterized protein YjbJ (UPF0337 family)